MRALLLLVLLSDGVAGCSSSDAAQPVSCCMIDTMCKKCPASYCTAEWRKLQGSHDDAACSAFIKDSYNCSLSGDLNPPYYYASDARKECSSR